MPTTRKKRLQAATTTHQQDHGSTQHRHIDMIQRMIHHPQQPITTYRRGRKAVTIKQGAHLQH